MRTHIIYIPGLGDRYDGFRSRALKLWSLWGVTATHVPITWYDGGDLQSKLEYVQRAIDRAPDDARIVLIGESAGATLALHAAQADSRIKRVVTLCGVARPSTPVSSYLRRRAPALNQAVDTLPTVSGVDVQCVRAFVDGVVNKKYSVIPGAKEHVVWSVGHLTTIVLCLTVLAPIMSAIAKSNK